MPTHGPAEPTRYARRFAAVVGLFVPLFVIQAGLFPFNFTTEGDAAERVFFAAVWHDLIVPDIVSNIVLYVPVGLIAVWWLDRRLTGTWIPAIAALTFGAAITCGVEYLQAYLPGRVSSAIDLAANIAGTAIGICLFRVLRHTLSRRRSALFDESRPAPNLAAARMYGVMLVIAAAVPFTATFDAARLVASIRRAHWVPFSSYHALSADRAAANPSNAEGVEQSTATSALSAATDQPMHQAATVDLQRQRLVARWLMEAASFLLLGLLVHTGLRRDLAFSQASAFGLTIWIGGGLAVLLSGMHLFITTRTFDATDVLFRWMGLGISLCVVALRKFRDREGIRRPSDRAIVPRCVSALIALFILFLGVIPFWFEWSAARLSRSVSATGFLPFASYDAARFDIMLADLMEKLGLFALLALSLGLGNPTRAAHGSKRRMLTAALVPCVSLSLLIEVVQLFSPIRTASLTDPIVAGVGACLGVAMYGPVAVFLNLAQSTAAKGHTPRRRTPVMSPTDELIATLTDPHADAPKEPSVPPRVPTR